MRPGTRTWLTSNGLFLVTFAALAVFQLVTILACSIGPGQDYNFHVFSADIAARGWTGDPAITSLYQTVNPTDANTLLYVVLFPFVKVLGPVTGFQVGLALIYFIGFPVACVGALALLRRPLWGALLAFPLCWSRAYSIGGFLPFVSSAPWFVLAIALFHRFMSAPATWRSTAYVVVPCAAVFLSHAHVHGWLMVILAGITAWTIGQDVARDVPFSPWVALRRAVMTGLKALAVVAPSLLLSASWWIRRTYLATAVKPEPITPQPETAKAKIDFVMTGLIQMKDDADYKWAGALILVVLLGFLLSARRRERVPAPELAFLLTIGSFFLLPSTLNNQAISSRQFDLTLYLLPLVAYAGAPARALGRHCFAVAMIVVFAWGRGALLAKHMRRLQYEVTGLFDMAKPCPVSKGEMAYVTFGREPPSWHAESLHQSHETLAAICKLDTPVYDTLKYPWSLQPVRYKGALPSPVTIITPLSPTDENAAWYRHPRLWDDFDLVLVRNWTPNGEQLTEAEQHADRIRVSGAWQLWQRKRR